MSNLAALENENETLRRQNILLEERNNDLEKKIPVLNAKIERLIEELKIALYRQYVRTSEKFVGQDDLPFEDLKVEEAPESVTDDSEKAETHRKKAGRKRLSDSIPRKDEVIDLKDHEKTCACGHELKVIGEDVHEKLMIVPRRVWVQRHHFLKYACSHCQGLSDETKPAVRTASHGPELFPRSIVSEELLAQIWTAKFCDHLPFYRQEVGFARIGAEISRQDMVSWTLKVSVRFKPLIMLIIKNILSGSLIQMDETPVKVLKLDKTGETGRGYMWLARGGPPEQKAVNYRFDPSRGSESAIKFLEGFSEFLQADGYPAYKTVTEGTAISLVGCWAHARRKFVDADKAAPSEICKDALGRIQKLYKLEKQARSDAEKQSLTPKEFVAHRKTLLEDHLASLKEWLQTMNNKILPSSKTAEAIQYCLNQWDTLVRFLEHDEITPDNNAAENAIRPFVVGRKNWLFHGNEKAAQSSCMIYSLIETAKLNGKEPYAYLQYILHQLPLVEQSGDWESLLPWNVTLV